MPLRRKIVKEYYMKLSFSTLGCPDWSFREILSFASDQGFDGIEIRGIADQIYAPKIAVFSNEQIDKTKASLERTGVKLPILTTGAYLCGCADIDAAMFEVKDYIMLASRLGVPYVRVLGEPEPDPRITDADTNALIANYRTLCDFGQTMNVGVLIETNGFLADSVAMRAFMERVDHPNAGIIWDVHHTFRFFGEKPADTVRNIGKFVKHTHIKDSVKGRNGHITYMLSGYGDVPVEEAYKELTSTGYDGYWSYEWVKRWSRELAEPGVAFYQYEAYMRSLED